MWDDAKQMNAIAATLGVLVAAALPWAGTAWLVRQPVFALQEVVVTKSSSARAPPTSRRSCAKSLTGTFFTMDLDRAQRRSRRCRGCAMSRCAGSGPIDSKSKSRNTCRSRAGTMRRW